jgi:hypothetical protein
MGLLGMLPYFSVLIMIKFSLFLLALVLSVSLSAAPSREAFALEERRQPDHRVMGPFPNDLFPRVNGF